MFEINLPKGTWWYDDQYLLGPPGGFGTVFRGRGADGQPVAVKRLYSAYQTREMRIVDFLLGHGLPHVIPILDAGFDAVAIANFIIMPIATRSLQQQIETGAPSEGEALEILLSIVSGLEEIGDIIHRDLKPGNILLHEDVWKLADLGLARFAEATTSLNTTRDTLTPSYAAPEQWRGERPQKATDVYALGCIVYALLHGAPPFAGPEIADFSHQHQFVAPPGFNGPPHLKRIAAACLSKAPELRPSLGSLRKQLQTAHDVAKGGRSRKLVADSAAAVLEKQLLEEQERKQYEWKIERSKQLASEAVDVLEDVFKDLEDAVLRDAPNTKLSEGQLSKLRRLSLGSAILEFGILFPWIDQGTFLGSREWHIVAGAYISTGSTWSGRHHRSANLWFGRLLDSDDYRWWEVSYVPYINWKEPNRSIEPFLGLQDISYIYNSAPLVAEDPRPVTPDSVEEFLDRWIERFAKIVPGDWHAEHDVLGPYLRQPISPKFRLDRP